MPKLRPNPGLLSRGSLGGFAQRQVVGRWRSCRTAISDRRSNGREERVKTAVVLAAVVGLGALAVDVAVADPLDGRPPMVVADGLPAHEIIGIARSSGFRPLGPPVRRGRVYVLHAVEPGGDDVRLAHDAYSGRILSAAPLDMPPERYGAGGPYGPPYERGPYGRPGPYQYGPPEPFTTGSIPGAPPRLGSSASAAPEYEPMAKPPAPVTRSAAVTPPRTPLPRPRPADPVAAAPQDAKAAAVPDPAPSSAPAQPTTDTAKTPEKPAANTMPPVAPLD
jgi:hypothetical protein